MDSAASIPTSNVGEIDVRILSTQCLVRRLRGEVLGGLFLVCRSLLKLFEDLVTLEN